jgi:hypothetical protein
MFPLSRDLADGFSRRVPAVPNGPKGPPGEAKTATPQAHNHDSDEELFETITIVYVSKTVVRLVLLFWILAIGSTGLAVGLAIGTGIVGGLALTAVGICVFVFLILRDGRFRKYL